MNDREPLVFDTGPLRHFAQQGWLRVLEFITTERRVVMPDSVEAELTRQAASDPRLLAILSAEWIDVDRSDDVAAVLAFARYEQHLVVQGANRGECGVLALGEVRGWEVVLDDATARALAEERAMHVTTTVALLCQAIRAKQLTVAMCEALADDLLANSYYLPFGPGGFRQHAMQAGLLDYEAL